MTKLWGGRFSKQTHKLVEEFTKSIHFDQKLAKYDCLGSLAHIAILKKAGLLTNQEHSKLATALRSIAKTIEDRSFFKNIDSSFEDIHSYIQHLVEKKAGKAGLKLHTCRSRNDQIVLDMKLFCLDELKITQTMLKNFSESLKALAGKNKGICLPGLTHLQHAMIISLSDYLGAYQEMLARDHQRLQQIHDNIRLTFGSGAIAGTSISASAYYFTSSDLPKAIDPTANSIDVVSDRDFIIETLSGLAVIGMHLSRLAEDVILWASKEFDFIDIDDAFCTGSSLMPQKKNPDVLELVRGYSGRLYGNLVNVLVMMKGLPLSYNRDMQLDKEPLFDSFEIIQKELAVLTELFKNVTFKKENIAKQIDDESLYATDLSDYLVQKGVAFKEAHAIIGKLIQHKYQSGQELRTMDDQELKTFHPLLNSRMINKIIDPEYSVKSKKSIKR
jgi:argininosuccinate lyase